MNKLCAVYQWIFLIFLFAFSYYRNKQRAYWKAPKHIIRVQISLNFIVLGLPNGAYTEVKFNTGMIFLCKMDGAVFNLTDKIIEVTSTPTQSTLLTTSMASENTSSLTPQSSLSLSISSVTGT